MKYPNLELGRIEAIINKLGGISGADRFLRDELVLVERSTSRSLPSWRREKDIIYIDVTSDGTTGPEWFTWFKKMGVQVGGPAKQILFSPDFKPTNGITYQVAIFDGLSIADGDRFTQRIRVKASNLRLATPNIEIACLIFKKLKPGDLEAIGFDWLVIMHEPFSNPPDYDPRLLEVGRIDNCLYLGTSFGYPNSQWNREKGFAFVVPQV